MSEAIRNKSALDFAVSTEAQIAQYKAKCIKKFGAQVAFGKPETQEQVLERFRTSYQMSVEKSGEVSCLILGAQLAVEYANRTIQ
jgi:hypothetical protein